MTSESPEREVDGANDGLPDDDTGDGIQSNPDVVEQVRQERDEHRDKYVRLAAELDNLRKRNAREVENARKYGIERFAQALLPVFDSIEASLGIEQTDVESLLEGQRATLRLLSDAFASVGVEQIDPHGHPFDPAKHEAISMLPSAHAEPHSVLDVIQKGYAIQERLLRPARVIVARPGDETQD